MNIGKWYTYDGTPESSTTSHEAGIDVMVVSQNEINNTSLVRVRPWGVKFSGSTYNLSQQTLTVKVNNSTKTSKTSYDFREATTDKKFYLTSGYPFKKHSGSGSLVSGAYVYDFTVKHNDNGTKTIPIYALIPFHNSASGRDWEVDIDLELPDIPRKNTLTYSYTTLEKPITFKIVKSSSNFTSTINLSFLKEGSTTEFIGLGDIFTKTSSTNLSYTLTEENLNEVLSFNKTETDVTSFVTITTFSKNQSLGSEMYSFSIPIKKTEPIVSATFVDTNATTIALTGDSSKIVKYISKPKVTIAAQAQQQADISSYSTVWGNSSSTAQETTFNSGIDSNILTVSAKDSRNWVGEEEYDLSTLGKYIEYIKPNFSKFTLSRPESTSNTINADLVGIWFNNSFGTTSNTLELKYRYKEKNGEYGDYQTITLTTNENNFSFNGSIGSSFNYQKQYDFEFVLTDKLMSVITTFNVESGESIVRIAETYVRVLGDLTVSGNLTVNNELINKQIGDVVITSTNENPSSRLGGTWELIDKEFKSTNSTNNGFNPNSTNVSSTAPLHFNRSGHEIYMLFAFRNNVSLTDASIDLGDFDFQELGITQFPSDIRISGYTDGGNAIIMFYITEEGSLSSIDVIEANIPVDSACYFSITIVMPKDNMLDSACDKFYWERTA